MEKNDNKPANLVITIGRQFGSGGREFGRKLADELGIAYYDKELLAEAARQAGFGKEFFERNDERTPTFLSGLLWFNHNANPGTHYLGSNSISDDSLYNALGDIIGQLARKSPCVIVGRTADYVLRDYPNVFNIFIHAPEDECIKRIMRRGDVDSEKKAREKLRKTNKLRASFYNFYTDKRWGHADSYHLSVDSSLLPMAEWVNFVADIIRKKYYSEVSDSSDSSDHVG